jgi:hypothetical protein
MIWKGNVTARRPLIFWKVHHIYHCRKCVLFLLSNDDHLFRTNVECLRRCAFATRGSKSVTNHRASPCFTALLTVVWPFLAMSGVLTYLKLMLHEFFLT